MKVSLLEIFYIVILNDDDISFWNDRWDSPTVCSIVKVGRESESRVSSYLRS